MSFAFDRPVLDSLAALPSMRRAAQAGLDLIALWPLGDAVQLDNDAKYTENLQVRTTLAFARTLTGLGVTMPDAEYVYEGAEAIPGRPQEIVDALLAADEAYDIMGDYAVSRDADLLVQAAAALGAGWSGAVAGAVRETVADIEAQIEAGAIASPVAVGTDGVVGAAGATGATGADGADGADGVAKRFAAALSVCDALLKIVASGDDAHRAAIAALPVMLYVNELREECSVPRICLADTDIAALIEARASASDTLSATVEVIAPLAAAEWVKHREDVLWDPKEAKERAKQEDEQRNRQELSAKFAHIKD